MDDSTKKDLEFINRQIEYLYDCKDAKEIKLDDIRAFEILVKIKQLLTNKPTDITSTVFEDNPAEEMSNDELMDIIKGNDKK